MKAIFKYPLQAADEQTVEMPRNAKCLSVAVQHGIVCVWALVGTSAPMEGRTFLILPTGAQVPDDLYLYTFLGTVLLHEGMIVAHVYVNTLGED